MTQRFSKDGHTYNVQGVGWGEPQTITAICSCGWISPTVEERWFSPDEKDFMHLLEPWRSVAKKYGPDQILRPGAVWGTRETAEKMALLHIQYDPSEDLNAARKNFDNLLNEAKRVDDKDAHALGAKIEHAGQQLSNAARRASIWQTVEVPEPPFLIPGVQDLLERASRTPPKEVGEVVVPHE